MQQFEVGRKCVCIGNGIWVPEGHGENYGPAKHEVVTILYIEDFKGRLVLSFEEYPKCLPPDHLYAYCATEFRPLEGFLDTLPFLAEQWEMERSDAEAMPV